MQCMPHGFSRNNMNLFSRFLQVRYSALPTTTKSNFQKTGFFSLPKRYIRLLLLILAFYLLFTFFSDPHQELHDNSSTSTRYPDIPYPEIQLTPTDKTSDLPPLYEEYRDYEDRVSNWNLKTFGKASDGYIYASSHASGAGWGNIMQELVFSTLLASGSGRGFVFDEYIWNTDGSKYSQFNGKSIPSRIPFSAMIAGHILGLPKSPGLPPSISKRVYDRICPQSEQLYVDEFMVKEHIGHPKDSDQLGWHMPGQEVLDAWLSFLDTPAVRDKKCILISGPQIFSIWLLHNSRLHSLMKTLLNSPVLNNWGWSELVMGVFKKNVQFFVSNVRSTSLRVSSAASRWSLRNKDDGSVSSSSDELTFQDDTPLPLLALHLRRGDYEGHCQSLAREHSTYVGMDTLPEYEERDAFAPPNITYDRESVPEEVSAYFTKHCFPSATQVSQRVREVLHDYEEVLDAEDRKIPGIRWRRFWRMRWYGRRPLVKEKVKKVYIMTNGDVGWLDEVRKALVEDAKRSTYSRDWEFVWSWEDIGNSRELKAGWEEKRVLQLVDMYVGQRAEIFVGNGFSTLTSNIVMLRKHRGLHPVQTRFW